VSTKDHFTHTAVNRYVELSLQGLQGDKWFFLYDNIPVHSAVTVIRVLMNCSMVITNPPYSPDQAPADIFLFPKWKLPSKKDFRISRISRRK
jgi:hypothetical protein